VPSGIISLSPSAFSKSPVTYIRAFIRGVVKGDPFIIFIPSHRIIISGRLRT
jgi:hypothetical protein